MIEGRALKYDDADDISTDVIWAGKYTYVQMPPEEMPRHALEAFDPEFRQKAETHSILVVGKNFGCGSSREQAAECLKFSGIGAVLGKSFARIFYRNAINIGLPVIESPEAVDVASYGDLIRIDLERGIVYVGEAEIAVAAYPQAVLDLINHGGLINLLRERR